MLDTRVPALLVITLGFASAVLAQPPASPSQPPRPVASVNTQPRVDVADMPRPIEMRDTLWIEDLTMLEVRDLVKAGKTTALILTGGIEENGPYLTTGKHNIVLLGDNGGNVRPLGEVAEALNAKWKAAGIDARAYSIPEYYNYGEVEQFEQSALGIHEKMEGLHDDYYISAIIAVHDPNGVRMPERLKAGKFAINGVSLAPIEKTVENGRKIIAFRTEKTVTAIKKALDAAKSAP